MQRQVASATVLLLVALGGCGAGDDAAPPDSAGTIDMFETVPDIDDASSSATGDPTSTTIGAAAPAACDADRRTLEVAMEAHASQVGRYPESQDELVGDYLRQPIGSYAIGPEGGVTRLVDVECTTPDAGDDVGDDAGGDGEPDLESIEETVPTADEIYEAFDPSVVEFVGGPECARELSVLAAAGESYTADTGSAPENLLAVAPYLDEPPELWEFDPDTGLVKPSDGSPCTDFSQDFGVESPES